MLIILAAVIAVIAVVTNGVFIVAFLSMVRALIGLIVLIGTSTAGMLILVYFYRVATRT